MTRDVASRFHSKMGETFIIPEAKVQEQTKLIPGTDGQKMSKSKDNVIDIFQTDKALRKQIMSIKTDSTPLESPKDWVGCNCFAIYELLATEEAVETMKANYQRGGYGYGHAKEALFELICKKFCAERDRYNHYMAHPEEVEKILALGAEKAAAVANSVLKRVRKKLGY
jgi:tryptophanyl-tRNA synthetase